jgi:hypothetical protein
MTDDEALAIIRGGSMSYIGWDNEHDRPEWIGGEVVLDGWFSADQLRAILHLAPKDKEC